MTDVLILAGFALVLYVLGFVHGHSLAAFKARARTDEHGVFGGAGGVPQTEDPVVPYDTVQPTPTTEEPK